MSVIPLTVSPPGTAWEITRWRERALNTGLVAGAVGGVALAALEIAAAVRAPSNWPVAVSATVLAAAAIVLAAHRGLNHTVRAWSMLVIGCLVAAVVLVDRGLAGSGRLLRQALQQGGVLAQSNLAAISMYSAA